MQWTNSVEVAGGPHPLAVVAEPRPLGEAETDSCSQEVIAMEMYENLQCLKTSSQPF
jgi:hypothetical protein